MNEDILVIVSRLSDDELVSKLKLLAQGSRQTTVHLIAHLAELAARGLHRREGPGKLFGYCTRILQFSEAAACNRIKAAKAARKFPVILDRLADGTVNLTTIRLLAPHLTTENHLAILAEAAGMTRREVDKVVARISPRPDVPTSVRKLPMPQPPTRAQGLFAAKAEGEPTASRQPEGSTATPPVAPSAAAPTTRASHRPFVGALSPDRFRIQITVVEKTHEDLRALQDLLRREIPDGDAAAIIARALDFLRHEVERKRFAATAKPRRARSARPGSRYIPAAVRRTVWKRDGGRCAFIAATGLRCAERSYLEYHHVEPHGHGGEASVENISLRCRDHNVYEAELIFGPYEPSRVSETSIPYGATP